ncbi:hypothetical protein L2E82_11957 [Cichorium intybus]|uniref:Uncharacterized protein n=1 Tax=Cichorium intybus TaxID=13427 RepID=A0ACB9GE79_CICIN|nr:hypothetical protein L2E82_11957 [Cichorium intybus]
MCPISVSLLIHLRYRCDPFLPPPSLSVNPSRSTAPSGLEKRARFMSPSRFRIKRSGSTTPTFPLIRSGSAIRRSITPTTQQHPLEAWKSQSLYPQRERRKDMEVYSKKNRNLFKALLSMHKYKNEYK